MLLQNLKLFFQMKKIYVLSIIGAMLVVLFQIRVLLYSHNAKIEINSIAETSIKCVLVFFVIVLVISFEYMKQERLHQLSECLMVNKSYLISCVFKYCILLFLPVIYTGISYLNVFFCSVCIGNSSGDYLLHSLKEHIVYFFFPLVIALLLGGAFSYISSYSKSVLGVVFVILGIGIIHYGNEDVLLGSFSDLLHIFCVTTKFVDDYAFFHSTSIHMLSKELFWIFLLMLVNVSLCFRKYFKVVLIFIIPALFSCFILFKIPVSGYLPGYQYQNNMKSDKCPQIDSERFYIDSYNMDLSISNELDAKVTVKPDMNSLSYYEFTLFYNYEVTRVQDDNGNDLVYYRNQNRLVIKPEGQFKSFTIFYHGQGSLKYYSCNDGIFLQGNFPYYPMAGNVELRDVGLCKLPERKMKFSIRISSSNDIYSNLEKSKDLSDNNIVKFHGVSDNLTLVAGYYKRKKMDDIDFLYPSASYLLDLEQNEYLYHGIIDFIKKDVDNKVISYDFNDKLFIIAPFYGTVENYMFGTDCIVLSSRADLERYYQNYVTTGDWYMESDNTIPDEIEKMLEETE